MPSDDEDRGPIYRDAAASAALTALETLRADGVVLLVQGGPYHGEIAVLCDPVNAALLLESLKHAIKSVEAAAQQLETERKSTLQ